jgi:hypothetical protein
MGIWIIILFHSMFLRFSMSCSHSRSHFLTLLPPYLAYLSINATTEYGSSLGHVGISLQNFLLRNVPRALEGYRICQARVFHQTTRRAYSDLLWGQYLLASLNPIQLRTDQPGPGSRFEGEPSSGENPISPLWYLYIIVP